MDEEACLALWDQYWQVASAWVDAPQPDVPNELLVPHVSIQIP